MAHRKLEVQLETYETRTQYLGTKLYAGEKAKVGNIIVRQREQESCQGEEQTWVRIIHFCD